MSLESEWIDLDLEHIPGDPACPDRVLVALECRNRAVLGRTVDDERPLPGVTRELQFIALDAGEPDDLDPPRRNGPAISLPADGLRSIRPGDVPLDDGGERREISFRPLADELRGRDRDELQLLPGQTGSLGHPHHVPLANAMEPVDARGVPRRAGELRAGRGRVAGGRSAVELQAALSSQFRVQWLTPPEEAQRL
jgi:hypothetical protein